MVHLLNPLQYSPQLFLANPVFYSSTLTLYQAMMLNNDLLNLFPVQVGSDLMLYRLTLSHVCGRILYFSKSSILFIESSRIGPLASNHLKISIRHCELSST